MKAGKHTKPSKAGEDKQRARNVASSSKERDWDEAHDNEAERRMKAAVRSQGRLTKKGGKLVNTGTSEFQVASADTLQKLVNKI